MILFVCLPKQALWNLLLLAYYKADFNNFQTHNNENYMTSGLCFKTIHSDHQTKWNAVVQLNCECHLLVHDDTVKYLFLFYRHSHWTENQYKTKGLKCCHLVFLLVRKGNYVSVNHHYGPEAQSTVWVFSSGSDSGSEDWDCRWCEAAEQWNRTEGSYELRSTGEQSQRRKMRSR